MLKKQKKIHKIFSITVIIILLLLALLYVWIKPYLSENLTASTSQEVKEILKKADFSDENTKKLITTSHDASGSYKRVFFEQGNVQVISFSDTDQKAYYGAGCQIPGAHNYIMINKKPYDVTIHNISILLKPVTAQDFIDILRVDEFFNDNCFESKFMSLSPVFTIPLVDTSCGKVFNLQASMPEPGHFIYYSSHNTAPAGILRNDIYVNGDDVTEKQTTVFSCNRGPML